MRKIIFIVLTIMIVLMVNALPANADHHGGHGGRHPGHGGHGVGRIGIGVYFGPGWWGPYPYYPYYPYSPYYPYYPVTTVIQQPPTDLYVQPAPQAEETQYWYYCEAKRGYYPTVKTCPTGWLKVVPPANPPE
jgi:hypothetical protein